MDEGSRDRIKAAILEVLVRHSISFLLLAPRGVTVVLLEQSLSLPSLPLDGFTRSLSD
jgi:hypothetical protein